MDGRKGPRGHTSLIRSPFVHKHLLHCPPIWPPHLPSLTSPKHFQVPANSMPATSLAQVWLWTDSCSFFKAYLHCPLPRSGSQKNATCCPLCVCTAWMVLVCGICVLTLCLTKGRA